MRLHSAGWGVNVCWWEAAGHWVQEWVDAGKPAARQLLAVKKLINFDLNFGTERL